MPKTGRNKEFTRSALAEIFGSGIHLADYFASKALHSLNKHSMAQIHGRVSSFIVKELGQSTAMSFSTALLSMFEKNVNRKFSAAKFWRTDSGMAFVVTISRLVTLLELPK